MSDDKDNEFERDFSEQSSNEEGLTEESNLENSDENIDPVAEANESLITMDSAPFDKSLENISQTLASIDNKMDLENQQLQKLDQLDQLTVIKDQLDRIENSNSSGDSINNEDEFQETTFENSENDEILSSDTNDSMGHNQPEISELYEKIDELEKKLLNVEVQSNQNNEKIQSIENTVERFEDLENEIQVEYEDDEDSFFKKLFKKKDKKEPYTKKKINKNNQEIKLTENENSIPKNTQNIIEEAEQSIKNESEIIIDGEKKEIIREEIEYVDEEDINNSKKLKYGLGSLSVLLTVIIILFFFDKFEIIDLSFNKVIGSILSLF